MLLPLNLKINMNPFLSLVYLLISFKNCCLLSLTMVSEENLFIVNFDSVRQLIVTIKTIYVLELLLSCMSGCLF